ncbi:MAG: hypothetical protein BGP07_06150 [Rhizobiales bacterium 63-22]|nr:MAG: hypothetical protein BGP07_06150 [Rhizobiales bacterium 63-22]
MSRLTRISGLSVRYGGVTALDGVDLDVEAGETLAVIGESGSGKSTLALALAGLLPADADLSGRIDWSGEKPRPGRDIGFVFQEPSASFDPLMTVGAQLVETIRAHERLDRKAARARAVALLDRVRIPDPDAAFGRWPHQFSGGQKQRIAIAMAIACGPRLLIADEPTSALDTIVQKEIVALLSGLVRADGMTLIFISHDIALASGVARRMAVFRQGRLVETGTTAEIVRVPKSDYTRALIAAVPVREHFQQKWEPVLRSEMRQKQKDSAHMAEPLLEARNLTLRRGGMPVLDDVSLDIFPGETLALAGPSGSGKSTLARVLLRLDLPDAGSVRFEGGDWLALKGAALRRRRAAMQMVFQDPLAAFNPRASVREALDEPLRIHGLEHRTEKWEPSSRGNQSTGLISNPATIGKIRCSNKKIERDAGALLQRVGLDPALASRGVHALSGGQRQRVAIARALATHPSLIVLDEAVSALDVTVRGAILKLLMDIQKADHTAYLFITHDLAVAAQIADRIAVMERGRIVECRPAQELIAAPQAPITRALIEAVPRLVV